MATYNTAFGALPDYGDLFNQGTSQTTQTQNQTYTGQQADSQQQTFAQMQQQGYARPAPPQPQQYQQYGGSQQANQARQAMLNQLQQQLAQPTRFDTDMFNQVRQAQAANLQTEFGAQKQLLDEEMARRGLSASSIASGRFGDLLGQQARALSDLDAQLLMAGAQIQAQDRLAAMQAGTDFADLAGSQDLAQFEANRVGQAQQFQEALQSAQFGEGSRQFDVRQALEELLGIGSLTGQVGSQQTLAAGQLGLEQQRLSEEQRQFNIQQALQEALGMGRLTLDQQRFQQEQDQFEASLEEQRNARLQQFGLSTQDLNLRAQQLQQQAQLEGRSLDIQEARNEAEVDLRSRALVQEAQLQGRTLDLQQARDQAQQEQFTAQQAAERERFYASLNQDQAQFAQSLNEQRDLRLQNLGISNAQLEQEARRLTQQDTSLSLQAARDQAEVSFRTQQLQQQAALEGRSLTMQEARQRAEEQLGNARLAEETAARLQQAGFTTQQLEQEATRINNQATQFGQSLSQEQTLRQAEINLRATQIANEFQRSGESISLDQARLLAQQAMEANRLAFNREELTQQESEFSRTISQANLDRTLRQQLGTRELDISQTAAEAQAKLASQNLLMQVMQAVGFDPKFAAGDPSWRPPQAPQVGQVEGAYRWNGTRWVPNVINTGKDIEDDDDSGRI